VRGDACDDDSPLLPVQLIEDAILTDMKAEFGATHQLLVVNGVSIFRKPTDFADDVFRQFGVSLGDAVQLALCARLVFHRPPSLFTILPFAHYTDTPIFLNSARTFSSGTDGSCFASSNSFANSGVTSSSL